MCGHRLCELIGGACSIASGRSRGCSPALAPKTVASDVFDEVRELVAAIERRDRAAAIRLAEIIRREAREDRNLLVHARSDEPELARVLDRLCLRHA